MRPHGAVERAARELVHGASERRLPSWHGHTPWGAEPRACRSEARAVASAKGRGALVTHIAAPRGGLGQVRLPESRCGTRVKVNAEHGKHRERGSRTRSDACVSTLCCAGVRSGTAVLEELQVRKLHSWVQKLHLLAISHNSAAETISKAARQLTPGQLQQMQVSGPAGTCFAEPPLAGPSIRRLHASTNAPARPVHPPNRSCSTPLETSTWLTSFGSASTTSARPLPPRPWTPCTAPASTGARAAAGAAASRATTTPTSPRLSRTPCPPVRAPGRRARSSFGSAGSSQRTTHWCSGRTASTSAGCRQSRRTRGSRTAARSRGEARGGGWGGPGTGQVSACAPLPSFRSRACLCEASGRRWRGGRQSAGGR